jgi:patatin-like phospholipase/acyl hydrolase
MSVEQVLSRGGPRKLLALDGGGIRGCISIEVLARLESLIRQETGTPDLVLGDWFDHVGGTSTGAILATCIASGMPVARIREFYQEQGTAMFQQASLLKRLWFAYEREPLAAKLREVLGAEARLGSPDLRCLLLLVLRNASTDSPWPLSNNPRARYNDRRRPDCNLDLPLWQLVRASAAAPTFFPPEYVRLQNKEFVFVDGGVTSYNNPSFLLFMMATLEPYRLQWATGPENMLLVSIGTGRSPTTTSGARGSSPNLLENARGIPLALMSSASSLRGLPKLFTYLRYDIELTHEGLAAIGVEGIDPRSIDSLDDITRIPELQQVGRGLASSVQAAHLAGFV